MVLWYVSVLLRKLWRYFPVFTLFCTLAFILDAKLFPWTAVWCPLGFHWCHGTGTGHCLCSLRSLKETSFIWEWFPFYSFCFCCFIVHFLICLFGYFLAFTYLFESTVCFCNNLFARWWVLSNSILFWRRRIETFLLPWRTLLVPFPGGGHNLCMLKLEILETSFVLVHVFS